MNKLRCPIREHSLQHPDHFAVLSNTRKLTYRELDRKISVATDILSRSEICHQDRVCIIGNNSSEFIIFFYAIIRLGAVACTISNKFPRRVISDLLESIHCKFLVEIDEYENQSDRSQEPKVYINRINWLTSPMSLQQKVIITDELELKASSQKAWLSPEMNTIWIPEDQDCSITFTSGTTGQAKALVHTYGNHWYSAKGANQNLPLFPDDRWALSLSLFHIGGLAILFRSFASGSTVVLDTGLTPTLEFLNTHRITHISLVPIQLKRLYSQEESAKCLRNLKVILLGGDTIPKSLILETQTQELPVYSTYGLTEMASQVTATGPNDPLHYQTKAGRLLKFRELKISTEGEILVKGRTLFKKCMSAAENKNATVQNGWYPTGDLGTIDENGYLSITGRKDNQFISGGENISPEEIESVLNAEEEVAQVVVVPKPDKEFGKRPVAFVRIKNSQELSSQKLKSICQDQLPRFKVPIAFYQWPENWDSEKLKPDRSYFKNIAAKSASKLQRL